MIAYTTANDVARETGWAMHGWGHGDRATNEAFAPLETYAERFGALLSRVRALGTNLIGAGFSGEARELAPVLREHGVTLAVENHPERTPDELLAKIWAGDGTMAATVDTGWWATRGYDPAKAIDELGDHVAHVHLKDVRHEGEPHETCAWGEGIVDVEACARLLRRRGYEGAYTVEHEPEDHDPGQEIRAMRERLERWLA